MDVSVQPGLKERWETAMVPNYPTPSLLIERGEGATVWDPEGRSFLDLMAGVAVSSVGHGHPALVAAVRDQVERLAHSSNLYANGPALTLAERLRALMGGGHRALLVNSGTEANEAAWKLLRAKANEEGRPDAVVLAFEGSFHGRTTAALALTGQAKHRQGFAPLPGAIVHVPFNDSAAIEDAVAGHDVVGVFAEAVQGEGGVVPMTAEAAATLQRACDASGALLVVDEVQTGIARTGSMFAHAPAGLRPDVVTLAKGLGGGLPIGACLVADAHAGLLGPGRHGCTFGGNPVAAAAANAVLDVVEKERLAERAARLGEAVSQRLSGHGVADRGLGLLRGVPLSRPHAGHVVTSLQRDGVLVGQAGPSVVRLAPPLTVPEAALMDAVDQIAAHCRAQTAPTPAA